MSKLGANKGNAWLIILLIVAIIVVALLLTRQDGDDAMVDGEAMTEEVMEEGTEAMGHDSDDMEAMDAMDGDAMDAMDDGDAMVEEPAS